VKCMMRMYVYGMKCISHMFKSALVQSFLHKLCIGNVS